MDYCLLDSGLYRASCDVIFVEGNSYSYWIKEGIRIDDYYLLNFRLYGTRYKVIFLKGDYHCYFVEEGCQESNLMVIDDEGYYKTLYKHTVVMKYNVESFWKMYKRCESRDKYIKALEDGLKGI